MGIRLLLPGMETNPHTRFIRFRYWFHQFAVASTWTLMVISVVTVLLRDWIRSAAEVSGRVPHLDRTLLRSFVITWVVIVLLWLGLSGFHHRIFRNLMWGRSPCGGPGSVLAAQRVADCHAPVSRGVRLSMVAQPRARSPHRMDRFSEWGHDGGGAGGHVFVRRGLGHLPRAPTHHHPSVHRLYGHGIDQGIGGRIGCAITRGTGPHGGSLPLHR